MPKVHFDNTDFGYPIFNMNIPDQYRARWFMRDIEKRFLRPGKKLPAFLNIAICNDHGADPKPDKGYPYLVLTCKSSDVRMVRLLARAVRCCH